MKQKLIEDMNDIINKLISNVPQFIQIMNEF